MHDSMLACPLDNANLFGALPVDDYRMKNGINILLDT